MSKTSFGALLQFQETLLQPAAEWNSGLIGQTEIVTYVQEGTLAIQEELQLQSTLEAGGIHCLTVGPSAEFQVKNLSEINSAAYCQIWLDTSGMEIVPRFKTSKTEIKGGGDGLVPLASGQGETTGVPLQQDVAIYLSRLRPNENLIFETLLSRRVFLAVINGLVRVEEHRLQDSDSAMIWKENLVEIAAQKRSTLLLVDLP
jgi:redox-sensitive bicupin YhaK (pirin superfamily)